jgi:hypothetical protein
MHASPPSAKAGFDPDSPFAALGSLRAAGKTQPGMIRHR